MYQHANIAVILPALNEAQSIGAVLDQVPDCVDDIIVADNASTDDTAQVAADHGARVVHQPHRGYGAACLAGIAALQNPDIVVFLDADGSDLPDQIPRLLDPIISGQADFVIGSRILGGAPRDALSIQQRFGSALACLLIRLFFRVRHTDLGPFRAISYPALKRLNMSDRDYGWTVQMQVRAAKRRVKAVDVPVPYRPRLAGKSKVSRTLRGLCGAAIKIFGTIFAEALSPRAAPNQHHLILFTRYPQPGSTKTRMIPAFGPDGAADLQRDMTLHTLRAADTLAKDQPIQNHIRYEGGDAQRMAQTFGDRDYLPQGPGSLGDRLNRAFDHVFSLGATAAATIGADCPDLNAPILAAAFSALQDHDVVLGPARPSRVVTRTSLSPHHEGPRSAAFRSLHRRTLAPEMPWHMPSANHAP